MHDKNEQAGRAGTRDRLEQVVEERGALLDKQEGEGLTVDDLTDIYIQVMGERRENLKFSLATRNKTNGDVNDYLEVRRPFGAAQ